MPVRRRISAQRPTPHRTVRPQLEWLEPRCLLSAGPLPSSNAPVVEQEPNDTLDQAQVLGTLTAALKCSAPLATGTPGTPTSIGTTSRWPARPRFAWPRPSGAASPPPFSASITATPTTSATLRPARPPPAGPGGRDRRFPLSAWTAGTYYVAVSGAGNADFNPFLADSGYPGQPCAYDLALTETSLPLLAPPTGRSCSRPPTRRRRSPARQLASGIA